MRRQQFWNMVRVILCVVFGILTIEGDGSGTYDPYGDSTLFQVKWPGSHRAPVVTDEDLTNTMVVKTKNQEKYRCILPMVIKDKYNMDHTAYNGLGPWELLSPLFSLSGCSYRIENFWTYELCHGKHLRQYHENKEPGKPATVQEYYLGKFNPQTSLEDPAEQSGDTDNAAAPPRVNVEGMEFAYFPVIMSEGTVCDINGLPRITNVLYVCHAEGKGEMYEVKEVASCEYTVVVFTKYLCSHPAYRPKSVYVNAIQCHALDGSPRRPTLLDIMELDNMPANKYNDVNRVPKAQGGRNDQKPAETGSPSQVKAEQKIFKTVDTLTSFLNGEHCVTGGSGWWTHELCFGRHVSQYHDDKTGKRTTIFLGHWDKEVHLEWVEKNRRKLEKLPAGTIMQFYSEGDYCDLSKKNRQTEVKLRCKDDPKHPQSVSIMLTEPRTCEYSLIVESPILCSVIEKADSDGVVPIEN